MLDLNSVRKLMVHFKSLFFVLSFVLLLIFFLVGVYGRSLINCLSRCPLALNVFLTWWHCFVFLFQSVLFKSAKKKKGMTVGFVSFESTEQLRSSVEVSLVTNFNFFNL